MFIVICVNIILKVVLHPVGLVCLFILLMLTQFLYLKIILIDSGVIKHVSKPT